MNAAATVLSPVSESAVNVDEHGSPGACFYVLGFFSVLFIIFLFPFSLFYSVKVCQPVESILMYMVGLFYVVNYMCVPMDDKSLISLHCQN